MKVKKKRKKYILQIALVCLLVCSVVQWMPETAQASQISLERYVHCAPEIDPSGWMHELVYNFQCTNSDLRVYCTYRTDYGAYDLWFISKQPMSIKYTGVTDEGETYNDTFSSSSSYTTSNGSGSYHYYRLGFGYPAGFYKFKANGVGSSFYYSGERSEEDLLKVIFRESDGNWFTWTESDNTEDIDNEASKGMLDNPIEDADIGCLVISKKKSSDLSGLGDNGNSDNKENLFRVRFGWKYKTNTGFSLQKNKYAQTFIQVRIQNRSVVYKNLSHTEIKRKLNSYGENAIIYSSLPVDHQPLVVTLTDTDFLKKYLPKYYAEINTPTNLTNALFLGNKYAFQFRVVCTDDLSVIPGNNTGAKWHCGRWTETSVDFDPVTPTDDEQKTGDIDDNGDFVQNEDDTTTKIDDASDKQYDSDDDASDDFNNSSKNNKDGFNWDSFKSLINQCKEVPGLIKSIFSFLPGWVLVFVAVGFGIWIFVLIKRAIV